MNDAIAVLRRHVTCRDYLPDEIPQAELEDLVRTAQQCATDATGQLYSVLHVRDPQLRQRFNDIINDQPHVAKAPVLLIVCLDTRRLAKLLEHRGEAFGMKTQVALLLGITDATLFAQSLVLAAESRGLGTCFLGSIQNHVRALVHELKIPAGVVPLWGLTLGKPRTMPHPKPRLPTRLVLHVDQYRDPEPADAQEAYDVMAGATRSGDWLNPIRKYFATGGVMEGREPEFRALLAEQGFPLD